MAENITELEQERQNLLVFIWKKRKILLLITALVAIVSTIVSFLITPLYRSTAIVFPAATSTVSFSEQRNAKAAAMDFGEEEQAEQLVQILQSSRIRDKIVEEYHLMAHYNIDSTDVNKYFKLVEQYNKLFLFMRTRFGSIQIDVLDSDPVLAANMANKIVELIDTVKNTMIAERTLPAFQINKRKKEQLEHDRDVVLKKLDSLSEMGVVSLDGRTNLYQAYVDSKNASEKADIKRTIDINIKYGSLFDGLEMIRNEKIMNWKNLMFPTNKQNPMQTLFSAINSL
jgi:tyrosine-protein kinase Etk/Wzc